MTETIDISRYAVETAASINDLKTNIAALKVILGDLGVGTKEYADTLVSLQTNQAALKNAMHDTTYEANGEGDAFAQTAKQAQGLGTSYNALVRQMADLDQQFRREEDVAKRDLLGAQIKSINAQLKELDAQRGKYARNVGNYESAINGLSDAFKKTAGSAGALIAPVQGATNAFKVLSTTPVVGMLGLLAGALSKVISGMKTSENVSNKWNQALAAFKPIGDAMTRTLQRVGDVVASLALKFTDLLKKWDLIDAKAAESRQAMEEFSQNTAKIERNLMVANAELEADVALAREKASDKEKYTAAQRLKFLEEAQWAEQQISKNNILLAERRRAQLEYEAQQTGNSIEMNRALAQSEVDVINARTEASNKQRTLLRQINAVRKELGMAAKDVDEAVDAAIEDDVAAAEAAAQAYIDGVTGAKTASESLFEEIVALDDARIAERERAAAAERAVEEANQQYFDQQAERERKRNEERIEAMFTYAGATASVLDSVADMFEANEDEDEKSAATAKALRTASAVIDTISGAVAAYMNTIKSITYTPVAIPMAVANAATVLAAGMAQIKQINSVKVGNSGGGGASAVASPVMAAPAVPQIRTITGAREEDRLNQMASNQRVYLVYSDIERANTAARVRVQETEF